MAKSVRYFGRPGLQLQQASTVTAPRAWEIIALGLTWIVIAVLAWGRSNDAANIFGPSALILIMGAANWQMVRAETNAIWSPLFGFRLGVAVFLGVGSLVPYLVDDIQLDRMMALYAFSPPEVSKVLLLWLLYASLIIAFAKVTSTFRPSVPKSWTGAPVSWLDSGTLGLIFIIVGSAYSVVIDLGFALGIFHFVLPGTVSTIFQAINAVGLFLIALTAFERRGWWYIVLVGDLVFSILLALILYNKSGVLFPILLVGIAILIRRVTVPRILLVAGCLFMVLSVLQPSIEDARNRHELMYGQSDEGGTIAAGTVPERFHNVVAYWTEGPVYPEGLGQGITRLSYLNIGAYLVAEYDLGIGGNTMSGALAALIPRFVWPNKPIVTDVGRELHERIFGAAVSFIAPTTAGDIYWNYGWVGVVLICPFLGVALWIGTLASALTVREKDWFMMPFVVLAFRTALGVDQAFVVGVFVPIVFSAILFFALRMVKELLATRYGATFEFRAQRR
jgi:hypothetical protein